MVALLRLSADRFRNCSTFPDSLLKLVYLVSIWKNMLNYQISTIIKRANIKDN